jgi:hypothetical protein
MPREIIGSPRGPFHVKVGWSRECDVQLGVEGDDGRSLNWLLYAATEAPHGERTEALQRVGRAVTATLAERGLHPFDADSTHTMHEVGEAVLNGLDSLGGYEGVWTDLDRAGCNRLIRTLRKARDDAYGRDE